MGLGGRALARGVVKPDADFWGGKRVFLTGHTGFKGAWMTLLLSRLGAQVFGFSLAAPVSTPSLFETAGLSELCNDRRGDICDVAAVGAALRDASPDVLIHMAAQPIVRQGLRDPITTFDVNVMGVVKVLEAARSASTLGAVVIVTSDKCYENRERVWPYRESEAMGGSDPYSASKGAAELVVAAYARSYFGGDGAAHLVSVRAGNVIGGGDWAADRLIPDLVRASTAGEQVRIRSPDAIRPWQHVIDPISGYLLAAERAYVGQAVRPHDAWNFGPNPGEELTVREVVESFRKLWPLPLDVVFADASDASAQTHREAGLLRVDPTKAKVELGWRPLFDNAAAISTTTEWYAIHHYECDAASVRGATLMQLTEALGP